MRMAPEVKQALADYAFAKRLSLNDAAVRILAARLGFDFVPSGQVRLRRPSATPNVTLRVPLGAREVINRAALAAAGLTSRADRSAYINEVIAEALGVRFTQV